MLRCRRLAHPFHVPLGNRAAGSGLHPLRRDFVMAVARTSGRTVGKQSVRSFHRTDTLHSFGNSTVAFHCGRCSAGTYLCPDSRNPGIPPLHRRQTFVETRSAVRTVHRYVLYRRAAADYRMAISRPDEPQRRFPFRRTGRRNSNG